MHKTKGLTLIELLTTIAIVSILMIQLPSFQKLLTRQQIHSDSLHLQTLLSTARTEAVRSSSVVVVCPLRNGSCDKDWNQTITLFIDNNNDEIINSNDRIIKEWSGNDRKINIEWNNRKYLRFKATAMNKDPGTFTLCPKNGKDKNRLGEMLTINMGGRSYFHKDNNNDGIVDKNGDNINCPS